MKGTTLLQRFLRSKATLLLAVLIVLTLMTMIVGSGVMSGAPFSAMFTTGFMSRMNLVNVFYNLVVQCIMLCGLACLLMSGNIDLSVGGQAQLASMMFAIILVNANLPWGIALVITMVFGAVCGLITTFLTNKLRFPPFIATIGMSSVYAGLANVWTTGNPVPVMHAGFLSIGEATYGIFPGIFLIAVVLMIAYQFMLMKTPFGRKIYMIGGNMHAAHLSGLNPMRMRMIMFMNNGILSAIAGVAWTLRNRMAAPTAISTAGYDFRVISAAVLGGVAFMGGSGDIIGGFVGVLLLNVLQNMLDIIGAPTYWNIFAQGAVLIIALILDFFSTERQRKLLQIR